MLMEIDRLIQLKPVVSFCDVNELLMKLAAGKGDSPFCK